MILTSCVLLLLLNQAFSKECVLDNGSRLVNQERKLDRDLLCNYDPTQPAQNNTKVTLRFLLKRFAFDSHEEIFTMYNWLFFNWVDDRLKWNPKDYDNISETHIDGYRLWTPSLKHRNKIAYEDFEKISNFSCEVFSTGTVVCVVRVLSQSECSTNLINWPYDRQSCTLKFGVYNKYKNDVTFTFNSSRGISMFGAEYGPGWNIIDFDKGENPLSETQFNMTFVVERQGECLGALLGTPSFVLAVLTVTSLLLKEDSIRHGIAILSVIGHFYIKSFLNLSIPMSSATTPSIVHFIVGSFFLTTFSIVLTCVFTYLRHREVKPYTWVVSVNDFASKIPLKFFIWRIWEERYLESAANETKMAVKAWTEFVNVINTFIIVLAIIIYVIMYNCFIPQLLISDCAKAVC